MELRPYQREDVERIKQFNTFGVFNEQRTGKTPTIITVAKEMHFNKIVVVCPKSAVYQWAASWEQWTGEKARVVIGTPKKRRDIVLDWTNGVIIIGYDTLKSTIRTDGMIDLIMDKRPDCVIADEAHRFKNTSSATYKAMDKLIAVPNRFALTGTPAHGKPEEIYAILHWLRPTEYRSYWNFIETYFNKVRRVLRDGRSFIDIVGFRPGMDRVLQKRLSAFTTQRKRKEVMPWLPQKDYENVFLPLSVHQKRHLKNLKEYFETEEVIAKGVLDRLIRYRQVCLAPSLLGLSGDSPKLNWLLSYFSDYPETPVIVFSKFTSWLKLISETLTKNKINHAMIIGDTPAKTRQEFVTNFQNGKNNILLINIDAGKEALTLDRAECIIFTDQYPPSSDILQAEDRFVATTTDKADKPHKIIRLCMKDSYDERIYKLVAQRASANDLLNDYKKYLKEE